MVKPRGVGFCSNTYPNDFQAAMLGSFVQDNVTLGQKSKVVRMCLHLCCRLPIQVSTRKKRSAASFENINRAASLFIAWMKTREDLHEISDRKDTCIFYPSAFKVALPWLSFRKILCEACWWNGMPGLWSSFDYILTIDRIWRRRRVPFVYHPADLFVAPNQLLKFIEWQEHRASLAIQATSPSEGVSGSGVQW